jgi:hypothetical protein
MPESGIFKSRSPKEPDAGRGGSEGGKKIHRIGIWSRSKEGFFHFRIHKGNGPGPPGKQAAGKKEKRKKTADVNEVSFSVSVSFF